jgi:hypothetical protein
MSPQTALITGASSGIGLELSKLFAADGYNLILVARNAAKLEQLAAELRQKHGSTVIVLPKDLSDPRAAEEVFAAVQAYGLQVDALVNNAGFGVLGPFAQSSHNEAMQMIQLNITALTALTHSFLPGMITRKQGRILNVGSTGSFAPAPLMAVYGATKAYVLSFSEALAEELRGTDVTVTAYCPGVTFTGFQDRSGVHGTGIVRLGGMAADDVARQGYRAMQRGDAVSVPGLFNKLLTFSIRLTPRDLARRMAMQLMKP